MVDICEATEVVISLGDQQITGKNVICRELNISYPPTSIYEIGSKKPIAMEQSCDPIEVTLTLLIPQDSFSMEMFDMTCEPKIRNKKVEDCSIQELLFAIRKKIKK